MSLHAPVLETPAAGPSARVRPRVTNGGGGKAGNQSNVEEARPGTSICKGADGEVGDDNEARADQPSPTRKTTEFGRVRIRRRDDRVGTRSVETYPDEG